VHNLPWQRTTLYPATPTLSVEAVQDKSTSVLDATLAANPDGTVGFCDGSTVNATPLLARAETVTTTFPVVAPLGTGTTMPVALQFVGVAEVPLNVTVLFPWLAPKFVPVNVTDVPTRPEAGERFVIVGGVIKVNGTPLLTRPETVTTALPVVARLGTGTAMPVELQLVGVATVPLNVIVLVP
jgi:hypothetical protein